MRYILANLINYLVNRNFIKEAMDICDILNELKVDDPTVAVNSIGLRGDTTPEQPIGGLNVEPFFFNSGDPL